MTTTRPRNQFGMILWDSTWVTEEEFIRKSLQAAACLKKSRQKHLAKRRAEVRRWNKNNREKINAARRRSIQENPVIALASRLRRRTNRALGNRGWNKRLKNETMLGCDFATLMDHIESLFLPGMTWSNRCEWHIDHKIPLASAKNEDDLIQLFHYTNLQPLWAMDNHLKGVKISDKGKPSQPEADEPQIEINP